MSEQSERPADMTGIERLRGATRLFDRCFEDFNGRFTSEELLKLYDAWRASGWDITPDDWGAERVQAALEHGTPPTFEDREDDLRSRVELDYDF